MTVPTEVDVDRLPPTLYLFMETLAARYRLGETHWAFSDRCAPAAKRLVDLGLIETRSGPAGNAFEARFTAAGSDLWLSHPYVPPDQRRLVADTLRQAAATVEESAATMDPPDRTVTAFAAAVATALRIQANKETR